MTPAWEEQLEAFERAWQNGPADLDEFLPSDPSPQLLLEFVTVDLQCRWRSAEIAKISGPSYLSSFPALAESVEQVANLCREEFYARQRWGDGVTADRILAIYAPWCVKPPDLETARRWLHSDGVELKGNNQQLWPRPVPDPRAPLTHHDFVLERFIGSGATGRVYRAHQKSLDRKVAIKALHKSRHTNLRAVQQFLVEAQLMAKLRHAGIVGIHGVGQFPNGNYFIVMDFVDGLDLERTASDSLATTIRWISDVAAAVEYAHQQGVLHCDLKPSNILLDDGGGVLITDFGFGQLLSWDRQAAGGTAGFLPPEQLQAHPPAANVAADVYALGALVVALCRKQTNADAALPAPLQDICTRCLEDDPDDRYPSVAAFREDLQSYDPGGRSA